jgi:ABC-type branched-subunit amino acid transport system substrate-binding protein
MTLKVGAAIVGLILMSSCSSSRVQRSSDAPRPQADRPAPPPKAKIPNEMKPEVIFQTGMKAYQAKDYNKAYDYFEGAAKALAGNPKEFDAKMMSLRSLEKAGRRFEVDEEAAKILGLNSLRPEFRTEIIQYRFAALESLGEPLKLLSFCEEILKDASVTKQHELYKIKCQDWVESKLRPEELESLASKTGVDDFRATSYFRLGELALEERDQSSARGFFAKAAGAGNSEWAVRGKEMLEQLEAVRRVSPKTIGAVLPLTGKHASVSQRVLRGMQFGLGLYGNVPSSFRLAVADSEGNPDGARRGVERLVREDNVIAVVGSMLSRDSTAVATKASELGVPSIHLSQKAGITEIGTNVFRNALTSEMQVRYLVKVAMEDLGLKKFGLLYPNDQYGVEFANIFWDEVLARGGEITAAQTYSPKETDFSGPVQRLVGTYYVEARKDEYNQRLKEWSAALKNRTARTTPPSDLLLPVINFDAVFIPDSAKALGQIAAMLSFNGVKDVKLMGTNLWNNKGVAKRAGLFADNLVFVDSFVPTDSNFTNSRFVREYKSFFNEDPGIFEIQGYDAALLLRQLISEGASGREGLANELVTVSEIPGALGPMSATPQREIMRPLVALTLQKGEITVLPKSSKP